VSDSKRIHRSCLKDNGIRRITLDSRNPEEMGRPLSAPISPGLIAADAVTALARLASIVESSDDAIIGKDLNGTIVSWNRGASVVYGYDVEEALGRSINLLVPPDLRDEEHQILDRIRAGQRIHHFDTVRVRKDGTRIDVSLTISPVWEEGRIVGASHIARDISGRKRLEAGADHLAAIVESSDDSIISKDLQGTVQTWNAGAERVYGYAPAEAIGRNISFLLPADRVREEEEILKRIARGEQVDHFETTRLRKDGNLIHVSVTISPIRDSSRHIVGASHVARDITERREMEEQIRQLQRLESVQVLASGLAHDFNNLLTGIIGNASLIGEELPKDSGARGYLDELIKAAERTADLTSKLLAYSGRGRFVVGPVNLSLLIDEVKTHIRNAVSRNIAIQLDLAEKLPAVEGDANQLHQLLMILICNGAEAIGEVRPGIVAVRTCIRPLNEDDIRMEFADVALAPGEFVCLEVRDDGCGMDEATCHRLFEPFFTTKALGRGLGLAAAMGIVKGHRGAIRVHSTLGKGTAVSVYLPPVTR
jgi:PAS domain S-box-containing protein